MASPSPNPPPFSALPEGTSGLGRALLEARWALKRHALSPLAAGYTAARAAADRVAPPPPRRLHVYGVGAPKSGTHSLANLFTPTYRAAHEPRAALTIVHLLRYLQGDTRAETVARLLRARDRWLNLEVEAAHYLGFVAGELAQTFPEARFVLTIREPYSWLTSAVNQSIYNYANPHPDRAVWLALSDYRYGRHGFDYDAEEAPLRAYGGVYPIGSYLGYWTAHTEAVLDAVPEDRLLVMRTHELRTRSADLARFLDIPSETLSLEKAHAFARPVKTVEVHEVVDHGYLEAEVARRCGPLMERFFPEVRTVDDALALRSKRPAPAAS